MNGRTFTKAEIKTWQETLTRIPYDIAESESGIRSNQIDAQKIQGQLEQVREIIRPMNVNITTLTSQIAILENQEQINDLQQTITREQKTIETTSPELSSAVAKLQAANAAVSQTKYLQEIKSAQAVVCSHPNQIALRQAGLTEVNLALARETASVSALIATISSLQSDISNLEAEERRDQMNHHHHHHHHGHHHHDDHHQSGLGSFFEAVGAAVHVAVDVGRSSSLASKRSERDHQQSQRQQHQYEVERLSVRSGLLSRELAQLQSTLAMKRSYLSEVPYDQQTLATTSDTHQLKIDLYQQEAEQRQSEANHHKLQRIIANCREKILRSESTIERLQKRNANLAKNVGDYATHANKDDLKQQLAKAEALRASHDQCEWELLKQDEAHQNNISAFQSKIDRLRSQQTELSGNAFLVSLRDDPVQLQKNLVAGYEAAVAKFDREHPTHQLEVELAVMYEMKQDVMTIQNRQSSAVLTPVVLLASHPEGEPGGNTTGMDVSPPSYASVASHSVQVEGHINEDKGEADGLPHNPERMKVYQLCGMLHSKMAKMRSQQPNSALGQELRQVSARFPLDRDEVTADYQRLNCPVMSHENMINLEIGAYNTAAVALRTAASQCRQDVKEWRDFANQALALADSIDANRTHPEFDVTFYTKMLIAAKNLLQHPTVKANQDAFNEYVALDTLGKANNCKRGGGAVSLFLGAALVVTTALADKFGYVDQYDVPPAAKYASYGVGGSAVLGGVYNLFKGQPNGSLKQGHKFSETARRMPRFFGQANQPQPNQQPVVPGQDMRTPLLSVMVDPGLQPSAPLLSPTNR